MTFVKKKEIASDPIYYYRSGTRFLPELFGLQLKTLLEQAMWANGKRDVLYLCIGSDRSTGDSLGPLVGYKLKQAGLWDRRVMGTLKSPIHALNLTETIAHVDRYYSDHVVVAVDASLGCAENVGCITLGRGGIKPGLGVRKDLQAVGDVFITGIIGSGAGPETQTLQNTRLSLVMELADSICEGICALAGDRACEGNEFDRKGRRFERTFARASNRREEA